MFVESVNVGGGAGSFPSGAKADFPELSDLLDHDRQFASRRGKDAMVPAAAEQSFGGKVPNILFQCGHGLRRRYGLRAPRDTWETNRASVALAK